jgi:integrase/recombinase XerD
MSSLPPVAEIIQAFFLEYLTAQRGVSPCTLAAYRDTFRIFLNFLREHGHRDFSKLAIEDFGAERMLAFCRHLECERGNGVRTVNCRLAAMRCFLRYASARLGPDSIGSIQRAIAIPFRRFTRPLLGYLSKSEMQAILTACDSSHTGSRDRLLFQFLYNTGARVSEACAVRVADVRRNDFHAVLLHGKGRKERVVPLWKESTRLIRSWVKHHPCGDNDPLFPNRFGLPLTRAGVQQRLSLRVKLAEPHCPSLGKRRISPHTIRHTTAMHLLQAGVAAPVISIWLGHEQLNTTHQYIEADLSMKEKALAHFEEDSHPPRRFKPTPDLLRFLEGL